ncbi:thiolase family protein [Allopusillimonas ginsengisoli]|uniref:thiolase family protein n=1 Tax=Allopusillimonas ginsengisoli TaxID=453575 RepID=UPI001021350E|nr:thiolase family protein [Allopusillimonas ginsengisoli]TEA78916.1 thiolase family protein [Allopusillimonas ginsengisoli]
MMSQETTTATSQPEIGIVGFGQSAYSKKTDRTLISLLADASRAALNSSGLKKSDIDGISVCSFVLPPDNAVTLAEQFGLPVGWAYYGTAGGAGPVAAVLNAVRAIEAGHATTVLCLAGDNYDIDGHYKLMDQFHLALHNYATPNGFGGANGLFGIVQRKHMETYGTQSRQLGKISVGQRYSAQRNPNALLRGPMTLDDYLSARIIADPIRLYDCVLPCAGAEAVIVTALDRVEPSRRIRILAGYEQHNYPVGEIAPLEGGWKCFTDRLFSDAQRSHDQLDFVQAYDDYPIMVAIQLEDLGFCNKGEVGAFLEKHEFSFNGSFPLNTNGGQLSCGQAGAAGGMIGLVEAVRQLRHEAGDFQVETARCGLVSGYGMVGYGHGLSSSAIILENEQ